MSEGESDIPESQKKNKIIGVKDGEDEFLSDEDDSGVKKNQQVNVGTHSDEILSDQGSENPK